jgi:hypothetical protein
MDSRPGDNAESNSQLHTSGQRLTWTRPRAVLSVVTMRSLPDSARNPASFVQSTVTLLTDLWGLCHSSRLIQKPSCYVLKYSCVVSYRVMRSSRLWRHSPIIMTEHVIRLLENFHLSLLLLLLWYRITKLSSVLSMQRDNSKLHVCFLIV